jgi:hypothetical protein
VQDSYDKVKEREAVEGLREKAKTIVAMEMLHPTMHAFPRYLHVAAAETRMMDVASIRAERDTGMTGRIVERVIREVDEKINRASDLQGQRMAGLEVTQKRLQIDVDEMKAMLVLLVEQSGARSA